jgi:hypothetical protein
LKTSDIRARLDDALAGPESEFRAKISALNSELMDVLSKPSTKHNAWGGSKRTVAVDFDGVIHSYVSPWVASHYIPDPPLPGAIDWICRLVNSFNVMIFSARCNDEAGIEAMKGWFINSGLPKAVLDQLTFEPGKPSAYAFIDDRAIQFTGNYWHVSPTALRKFTPWYYEQEEWKRKK